MSYTGVDGRTPDRSRAPVATTGSPILVKGLSRGFRPFFRVHLLLVSAGDGLGRGRWCDERVFRSL